jgi:hypothetical protein
MEVTKMADCNEQEIEPKEAKPGQLFEVPSEDCEQKIIRLAKEISQDPEPLASEEVEFIALRFWTELDYRKGNITCEQYEKRLRRIERGG